jgi:ribonuclease HI
MRRFAGREKEAYQIHVDGSPGSKAESRAGWGLCLVRAGAPIYMTSGSHDGKLTSNGAELLALSQGLGLALTLSFLPRVKVFSDSTYAVESMRHLPKLQAAGWRKASGYSAKNREWLEILHTLFYGCGLHKRVVIRHERGHAGIKGNEIADRLSKAAARGDKPCGLFLS